MIPEIDQDSVRQLLTAYTLWADSTGRLEEYSKETYTLDDPIDQAEAMAQAFIATITALGSVQRIEAGE